MPFYLSCPSATFALQRGGFVPREWLAAKVQYSLCAACDEHKKENMQKTFKSLIVAISMLLGGKLKPAQKREGAKKCGY